MENFFNLPFLLWIGVLFCVLCVIIGITFFYSINNTAIVFRINFLGKSFIFFPKEYREVLRPGIIRRYASQYTKGLSRSLLNDIIVIYNSDPNLKSRLNRYVLSYKFDEKGLEFDFLLCLSLMQIKYLNSGIGVNEDTIDNWLKRLNVLISNRYITRAITQEQRNILIAELIRRFVDKVYPNHRLKNVFYIDFIRDVHLVEKIEPIVQKALDDIEIENMLFKLDIKSTALFSQPTMLYRMWIYQHAVLCRNWIK